MNTGFLGWVGLLLTLLTPTITSAQEAQSGAHALVPPDTAPAGVFVGQAGAPDTTLPNADPSLKPGPNLPTGTPTADGREPVGAQAGPALPAPSDPVPFEAVAPGPKSPTENATDAAENGVADGTETTSWSMAPVRWGGSVSGNINTTRSGISQTRSNAQILGLRGASYIYQPWFAQVSGNLDLLSTESASISDGSDNDNGSRSEAVNYGLNLNLFPVSRFPLQAYVQQSDSRADANIIGTQYKSTRMGASQNWRPERGNERVSASFDQSNVATNRFNSKVDAMRGSYATSTENHNLNGSFNYSKSMGDLGGQRSNLLNLHGNHFWNNWEDGLSVSSFANISDNQIGLQSGSSLININSQILQLGNNVTWRPDEEIPLTLNGGVNMISSATATDTDTTNLFNVNGFANSFYRFNNNLSASGGLILLHSRSAARYVSAFGQNGALTYTGNPIALGKSVYNWGTGLSAVNQNTTTGTDFFSTSTSAQHGLSRSMPFSDRSALTLNATQAVTIVNSKTSGINGASTSGANLSHSLGSTWFSYDGEGGASTLSGTFTDSRSLADQPSHYRNLSAYGNLQSQLSRRSFLTLSLNVNANQQIRSPAIDAGVQTTEPIWSGAAGTTFSLRNPFDVKNMTYLVTVRNNYNQTNLRVASGDPSALSWQTGVFFQQSLDYRVGRLSVRTSHTDAENNGVRVVSLFVVVARYFGEF